jgi:hypothetical protein
MDLGPRYLGPPCLEPLYLEPPDLGPRTSSKKDGAVLGIARIRVMGDKGGQAHHVSR